MNTSVSTNVDVKEELVPNFAEKPDFVVLGKTQMTKIHGSRNMAPTETVHKRPSLFNKIEKTLGLDTHALPNTPEQVVIGKDLLTLQVFDPFTYRL